MRVIAARTDSVEDVLGGDMMAEGQLRLARLCSSQERTLLYE